MMSKASLLVCIILLIFPGLLIVSLLLIMYACREFTPAQLWVPLMALSMWIIMLILSDRMIWRRIKRITREMAWIAGRAKPDARLEVEGEDEISTFTKGVNQMLDTMEKSYKALQLKEERLKALALHLQSTQEQESQRISHRIHNDLGQMLVMLNIELASLARAINPENKDACNILHRAVANLQITMKEAQTLARHLRPRVLDELDFQSAVEWLVEDLGSRSGLSIAMEGAFENWRLSKEAVTALFRIIQESLLNVVRHAHASRVLIKVGREGNALRMMISDDGIGFNPRDEYGEGFGLDMMRERAECMRGKLHIVSDGRDGCGTRVEVLIPSSEYVSIRGDDDD